MTSQKKTAADLLVDCLIAQEVEYIFCVPGASIDPILNVLADRGPKIIVCRHEQNAAFMAQAWGKITGKPGVCLATAGPGATNLVTGIATASSERAPVVAITGQVSLRVKFKQSHQNINAVSLFEPITKWSIEIDHPDILPDVVANAFQAAMEPREGAVHISIPRDILGENISELKPIHAIVPEKVSQAMQEKIQSAAEIIDQAKFPVLMLGMVASKAPNTKALREFLRQFKLPVVATFEAAGAISKDLLDCFMGRLGIFRNQPGDEILKLADVLITIGFDPVEYDPYIWNKKSDRKIVHLDEVTATLDQCYQPKIELIGNIAYNLKSLLAHLNTSPRPIHALATETHQLLKSRLEEGQHLAGSPVHPLRVIYELSQIVTSDIIVISDVGSHQYWMASHFFCYEPGHFLTSMGFQTMGIALPWAIAAALARPNKKVLSVSGDGSFLMSSMELETAVRLNLPIVHMVWEDGAYNLVKIQQHLKYGRDSGACFGNIDTVKYAESFGAKAFRIEKAEDIASILQEALTIDKPVVISVPIDYSDNMEIVKATVAS